ncbi:MAG: hypothetical protein H0W64_10315 [Gammaproteobacteria bacterium]|nr:hypothetical protein [Gammaproteobacteria bacterium]
MKERSVAEMYQRFYEFFVNANINKNLKDFIEKNPEFARFAQEFNAIFVTHANEHAANFYGPAYLYSETKVEKSCDMLLAEYFSSFVHKNIMILSVQADPKRFIQYLSNHPDLRDFLYDKIALLTDLAQKWFEINFPKNVQTISRIIENFNQYEGDALNDAVKSVQRELGLLNPHCSPFYLENLINKITNPFYFTNADEIILATLLKCGITVNPNDHQRLRAWRIDALQPFLEDYKEGVMNNIQDDFARVVKVVMNRFLKNTSKKKDDNNNNNVSSVSTTMFPSTGTPGTRGPLPSPNLPRRPSNRH